MRDLMRQGVKSILYTAPTGSGKTALTAHMLHTAAGRGKRSIFVVHRRELIKQSAEAFDKEGIEYGIISAGFEFRPTMRVQIASVQTLTRRLDCTSEPSLIVYDECHHIASTSWTRVFQRFPNAYHIGLTATPARLDGKGLKDYFQKLVVGPSVRTLIDQGYLSPFKIYAPTTIDTSGLHTRMGDYEKKELEGLVDRPTITGDAVSHYKRLADGKRAIVFCASIRHSQNVVDQFRKEGINATHVDGETPIEAREKAIYDFTLGTTKILSNVELFGEGLDISAVEAIILLRPTASLCLHLQQVGRGLRVHEGKQQAIILDHAGNTLRHGFPDQGPQWSLEGYERKHKPTGPQLSVRVCPSCFAAQKTKYNFCEFCGFQFEIKSREIREKEGELKEVQPSSVRNSLLHEQGKAQTLEDLYKLGVSRHYKNARAWAYYVFKARLTKRNRVGVRPTQSLPTGSL